MTLLRNTLNRLLALVLLFSFSSVQLFSLTTAEKQDYLKILNNYKQIAQELVIQVNSLIKMHNLSIQQQQELTSQVTILKTQAQELQGTVKSLMDKSQELTQQSQVLTRQSQELTIQNQDLQTLSVKLTQQSQSLNKTILNLKSDLSKIQNELFWNHALEIGEGILVLVLGFLYVEKK